MKRVYSSDGTKSAPLWFILVAYALAGPIVLLALFLSRLYSETISGFRYAWLDVREEIEVARKTIRNAR